MKLVDHPRSKTWLEQFHGIDHLHALFLLRTLTLVSHNEFEKSLSELIYSIPIKGKERVALFCVRKPKATEELSLRDERSDKERRNQYSSADRVGYLLKNIERSNKQYQVEPTLESMRAEKTKHIILVDDISGTGKRILDYWKSWANPTLRSWLSYKKCKLWLVLYAIHPIATEKIFKSIGYLGKDKDSIKGKITLLKTPYLWDEQIEELCERYAIYTHKPKAALGYGKTFAPIVFQHGCPNNTPVILWGQSSDWTALFPNQSVPANFQDCFQEGGNAYTEAEILWESNQPTLALQLIDEIDNRTISPPNKRMLTMLGLRMRGVKADKIAPMLMISREDFLDIVSSAKDFSLIDDQMNVTNYGAEILTRYRVSFNKAEKKLKVIDEYVQFYYPRQYLGVQRKSSIGSTE